ncbi:MAG: acyl-CoA dehydrogenase family protein, partial [Sandaracinaceae bacterium]|nr:acyl-CoA dehydrogenase family protein [Sandaracinaceae bacterium]
MDFSLSEEQREIQQAIRKILGDLVTDERHKALEREGSSFDRTAFDALAEAGMLGLAIPEAYDGAGLGLLE